MRLSRLADYAIVLMTYLAQHADDSHAAGESAVATRIPVPTTSRIMARLCRAGFLTSARGVNGGYRLARPAAEIPVGAIVNLFDGPVILTRCVQAGPRACGVEAVCPSRSGVRRLNDAVRKALDDVSLAELAAPAAARPLVSSRPSPGLNARPQL